MSQTLPILTLTLNPTLDMATEVPVLLPDMKLRCSEPLLDPGGGGLNVSRAIKALGGDSLALVALGGLTGERLGGLIRAEGLTFLALLGPGETRTSLTVRDRASDQQFRFMLPGPIWAETDRDSVFTLLRATARPGGIGVISGSQPPGVPPDFPAQLALAMAGSRVVLDTSGPALVASVNRPIAGLEVLRMDGIEAEALAGRPLSTRIDTANFAQELVRRGVAQQVIMARGSDGNVLAESDRRLFVNAPPVRVKSPVGAGDSFVAGLVLAMARRQPIAEALRLAATASAAAVMTDATQLCRPADVLSLLPQVEVTEI